MAANFTISAVIKAVDKITAPVSAMAKKIESLSVPIKRVGVKLEQLGSKISSVGKSMTASLTLPLGILAGASLKTTANFERLLSALETSTGSAAKAKEAFATIKKFAATTPFEVTEVTEAFIKLKNLGLDPSERALTSYGNTAGAMGKGLNDMIEAVADASTGEFERLKEFGIKSESKGNKVKFTFQGVTTTVRKSSKDIQAYLLKIGETKFAGGMERQAKTLGGAFSNLQDGASSALDTLGQEIVKTFNLNENIRKFTDLLNDLVTKFTELPGPAKKAIIIIGSLLAVLGPLVIGLGLFVSAIGMASTGLAALGTAIAFLLSPIGLFLIAIAAVAAGAYLVVKNWETVKAFFSEMWQVVKDGAQACGEFIVGVFDAVAAKINAVINGVKNAIATVKDFATNNALTRGFNNLFGDSPAPGSSQGPYVAPNVPVETAGVGRGAGTAVAGNDARANVVVDFKNVPKGTRVDSGVKGKGMNLGVDVGYQTQGAF